MLLNMASPGLKPPGGGFPISSPRNKYISTSWKMIHLCRIVASNNFILGYTISLCKTFTDSNINLKNYLTGRDPNPLPWKQTLPHSRKAYRRLHKFIWLQLLDSWKYEVGHQREETSGMERENSVWARLNSYSVNWYSPLVSSVYYNLIYMSTSRNLSRAIPRDED